MTKLFFYNLLYTGLVHWAIIVLMNSYFGAAYAVAISLLIVVLTYSFGRHSVVINQHHTVIYFFPFYLTRIRNDAIENIVVDKHCVTTHLNSGKVKKIENIIYDARKYIVDRREEPDFPLVVIE